MIATVSKKPNSSEEVMKALERFTAEGGWDGCDKEVWSLFMQFVRLTKRKSARLLFGLSSALVRAGEGSDRQLKSVFDAMPESKGWVMDFIDDENRDIPDSMTSLLRS